jgi:hypothetical protein
MFRRDSRWALMTCMSACAVSGNSSPASHPIDRKAATLCSMASMRFFKSCARSSLLPGDSGLLGEGGGFGAAGLLGDRGLVPGCLASARVAFWVCLAKAKASSLAMAAFCLWGCPLLPWLVPPTWHSPACHAPSVACLVRPPIMP